VVVTVTSANRRGAPGASGPSSTARRRDEDPRSSAGRPIEVVITFPPGGPTDAAARILQPKLSAALGVPASLSTTMPIVAPARIPRDVLDRLARALERTAHDPGVVEAIERLGMFVDYRNPEVSRRSIETEHDAVARIAKTLDLK
jgi:tripartite-type tricarboxylate transporter receptor subunit TctC